MNKRYISIFALIFLVSICSTWIVSANNIYGCDTFGNCLKLKNITISSGNGTGSNQTLAQVLSTGNNANNQNILGVNNIFANNICYSNGTNCTSSGNSSSTSPAGIDNNIQFNLAGNFSADNRLNFTASPGNYRRLTIGADDSNFELSELYLSHGQITSDNILSNHIDVSNDVGHGVDYSNDAMNIHGMITLNADSALGTNIVFNDPTQVQDIDIPNRALFDNSGATSTVEWQNLFLNDHSGINSVDWGDRLLLANDGTQIIDYSNPSNPILLGKTLLDNNVDAIDPTLNIVTDNSEFGVALRLANMDNANTRNWTIDSVGDSFIMEHPEVDHGSLVFMEGGNLEVPNSIAASINSQDHFKFYNVTNCQSNGQVMIWNFDTNEFECSVDMSIDTLMHIIKLTHSDLQGNDLDNAFNINFENGGKITENTYNDGIEINGGSGSNWVNIGSIAGGINNLNLSGGNITNINNIYATNICYSNGTNCNSTSVNLTANNHLLATGNAPSVVSCGTAPNITGNDVRGNITIGSGISITGCSIFFNQAYTNPPVCLVNTNSLTAIVDISSINRSAFTTGFSVGLGGGQLYYHCIG